ncbi:LysR family transcriptional regulator [Streptomyces xiaopingdaonensis]|uniref:LysR family transcriptional regulator n=1 Tax=Streptomyces xiaopingdaonensis TaxID=1565415 RepID=UPI0002F9950F|nr:LysR family transcriptional regulator [Streptomyces xiaopingdaonensis]
MYGTERLRALDAVATHGTLALAARILHVTPSGVSQQLARLERESGRKLLEPAGRGVRLTQAGRVLAVHARRVVAQLAAAESDLADLEGEVVGPLRIGGIGSSLRTLLPDVLSVLTERHPRLAPSVVDGEAADLVPMVLGGELDLLLAESWTSRPMPLPEGLALRRIAVERVDVALSTAHPCAGRDVVDLAELDDEVWASCPPGSDPYESLVQALRGRGIEPRVPYRLGEFGTQLAFVANGLAVALVPEIGQRPSPAGVSFVPVRPELRREMLAVWHAQTETPSIRACVDGLAGRAS